MVAAKETHLEGLLEGKRQYRVPLYQRTYSWRKEQLQRLWDDVVKLAETRLEHPEATHFMGSVVLAPSPFNGPVGVQSYLVVDGQQRLTTLTLLLAALRDHRHESEGGEHRERINDEYLINRYGEQQTKVLPTQADRESYDACIRGTAARGGADSVGASYRFFASQIASVDDPEDELDIERLEEAVTRGLTLVSITAQAGDNVHRIFESLNNTGLRLTQGDLVRNYLFMRMPSRGEEMYQQVWLPLQSVLASAELEQLFWLDLVQRDDTVTQSDTYARQQARMDLIPDEDGIVAELQRIARLGRLLHVVLNPEQEPDAAVRTRLQRLRDWDTTTVVPLLVHLLDRRDRGEATSAELASAMLSVESYIVRRVLSYKATAGLNRVLLRAVIDLQGKTPVDAALRAYLSAGRRYWATDEQIRAAADTVPLYYSGRKAQQKLILLWLEESFRSKEPVDPAPLTIEHVMPQTPTQEWQDLIEPGLPEDEDFATAHAAAVHTLGNLTLTGYNSELSNNPWSWKKTKLATSGLHLNMAIAANDEWTLEEIRDRGRMLAELAITLWPGPDPDKKWQPEKEVWSRLNLVLAELPAGTWASYGDVAAVIGTHQVPLGQRLATHETPNAHRVLQSSGTISPSFRWTDPTRTESPRAVLEAEGVMFDENDRASVDQRMTAADLATLSGLSPEVGDIAGTLAGASAGSGGRLDSFMAQLDAAQEPSVADAVKEVLRAWADLGGTVHFGSAQQTSCFLIARDSGDPAGSLWPVTIYPAGKLEVVFEYMSTRPPFDDDSLRLEFLTRLNAAQGVDLSPAKIALRPGIPLAVLADDEARGKVIEALAWFLGQAHPPRHGEGVLPE